LEEILKFAETSKPSLLFKAYLSMLMVYSQRRSKLDDVKFNKIVEQLKPKAKMATAFKSFLDLRDEIATEKGIEKGIAIAEAKARKREQELKRQTVIRLIKTTRLENIQIAEIADVSITFVEAIRLELSAIK
jgi:hypothetical protein